jgi:hypothetical protein
VATALPGAAARAAGLPIRSRAQRRSFRSPSTRSASLFADRVAAPLAQAKGATRCVSSVCPRCSSRRGGAPDAALARRGAEFWRRFADFTVVLGAFFLLRGLTPFRGERDAIPRRSSAAARICAFRIGRPTTT